MYIVVQELQILFPCLSQPPDQYRQQAVSVTCMVLFVQDASTVMCCNRVCIITHECIIIISMITVSPECTHTGCVCLPAILGPLHERVDVGAATPTPDDAVVLQLDHRQGGVTRGLCKGVGYGPHRQLKPGPHSLHHASSAFVTL